MLLEGEKLLSVWVLVFGIALFFLARVLGTLYVISKVEDVGVRSRASARLLGSAIAFVVLFVAYLVHWLLGDGFGEMWYLITLVLIGFLLILHAVVNCQLSTLNCQLSTLNSTPFFLASAGTFLIVFSFLLGAG
jgi:cytochrome d ubiquinol oxidase subunit II